MSSHFFFSLPSVLVLSSKCRYGQMATVILFLRNDVFDNFFYMKINY